MQLKQCLVLDDEQHSIDILTDHIQKTPNLSLLAALKNPIEAIPLIESETIDIAFIDVQMPNLTGLQFLKLLKSSTKVILCTAYSEYAIDGFELNVADYLLKPISFERFIRSVQKIDSNYKNTAHEPQKNSNEEYIFVKADAKGKFIKVNIRDILYIEGLGNYQKIQTAEQQIVTQLKMKTLEEQLAEYGFIRIHKSFIIQKANIKQIEGNMVHVGTFKIPIGEHFKEELFGSLKGKIMI
jgi:two-component system, LytTR family, response regulator